MQMDRRQKHAYALASEEIGLSEIPGEVDEPRIVQMFATVGHAWVQDDETAWCAAAIGTWLHEAGLPHTGKLNARSYLGWGEPVALEDAQPGDVLVFSRGDPSGWQGHVGFYVGTRGALLEVLGGNQSNQVNVARYHASRLLGVRRFPASTPTTPRAPVARPAPSPRVSGGLRGLFRRVFGGKR